MKITLIILALFQIMGLISSVHAILRTRTPQGAIAWAVSLNALPVLAVPAYWVFGRSKFEGYVDALRNSSSDIESRIETAHQSFKVYERNRPDSFPEYQAVRNLARAPFLKGNQVELLIDGKASYDSLYEGIASAKEYILFQFYILRPDESGDRFKELLIRKAAEGVRVYVLYDEMGSSDIKPAWKLGFEQAGIPIIPFNTRQGKNNHFQLNFRNHRKIVVVDGDQAWLGGLNIGDEYLGEDPKLSPWRDTHLRIKGPAALLAQSIFSIDWFWADKQFIEQLNWVPADNTLDQPNTKDVLIFGSGPADKLETASLFFTTALNVARQRIWIATPYFIPDEATMTALRLALLKGLDVRILTPALNDNWFVHNAAKVYLSELSQLGAKIYYYEKGFMHQKVMLVDSELSIIGTVNFDNRSFRLNFEVSAAIADQEFASQLETMLRNDLSNARQLQIFRLEDQPVWQRFKAHAAALLAPIL